VYKVDKIKLNKKMDILRRFLSFVNRADNDENNTVPVYYLGHTYTAEATSDELKRAAYILTSKNKNKAEKSSSSVSSINFEENDIILRDGKRNICCEFDTGRIVVSCVDAKNQRLLAIFYHNDSPCIAGPMTTRGLECHLFLCKTKDIAKQAANHIGELLNKKYSLNKRPDNALAVQNKDSENSKESQEPQLRKRINVENNQIRYSKIIYTDQDLDYENINNFFRKKVLNVSLDKSFYSTPSDSLMTFITTTGYDSGRGSASPSIDIRTDDIGLARIEDHINRNQNDIQINSIRKKSNQTKFNNNESRDTPPNINSKYSDNHETSRNENPLSEDIIPERTTVIDINDDDLNGNNKNDEIYGVEKEEYTKLLRLSETDI